MAASLEKKAEKNILESIDKLVTNSFLMLLFESLMVKSNPSLKDTLKEKSIKGIYEYIIVTTKSLRRIIDEGGAEKEFHLRKSLQLKENLLEIYEVVKIYISACNILDLCIDDHIQAIEGDDGDISLPEVKRLLKIKTEQIFAEAEKYDVEEAASAILFTILPNYFSDRELIDYIDYSGKFYFENSTQAKAASHINQIMRCFAPYKMPDYGKYYAKEAAKLYDIIETVRSSGFGSDFKKIINKYDKVYSKIEGIADILSSLYTELTYITIILSSMFTFDDILKNNPILKDYYLKTIELQDEKVLDEAISDALLASLDSTIEEEMEQLNELEKRKELIYKNVNFENFSENTKTLFSMEFFMTTAFFENIEDADGMYSKLFEMDDKKFADLKSVQREMKALTLFIKENCIGMSETLKRGARHNLFLSVPLVSYYNKENMMKYMNILCENIKSVSEIEGALGSMEKILDDGLLQKLSVFEV